MVDMEAVSRKGGLLYPMLVIAAIAVIVFSVTGIATMMGWLPSALSERDPAAQLEQPAPRGKVNQQLPAPGASRAQQSPAAGVPRAGGEAPRVPAPSAACTNCGVVESIRAVEVQGQSSWLGAASGAVVGGLLGNQVGHGRGRTAATVAGAGAGAYAGNEIEKNVNKSLRYRVRVRMDDGTFRTFHETAQPAYTIGQKVRVNERGIVAPAG